MIKPLTAAIGMALLAGMTGAAWAQDAEDKRQDKAIDLDQVIVTGTRTATAIDKIPGAITLVSKEEVQRTLSLTEDATAVLARTVPGYAESSQAMSNTGETLRGRIALRLFDGIPQGSPLREGNRNGTFTDMGVVGRIEVINGPSASEGIGAAGGIINYISKVPTVEGHETEVVSRYSTQFGDDSAGWKLGVNHAYKGDDVDALLSASYIDRGISYDGNGRRIGMNTSGSTSDSEARNLFLKAGYNFGESGAQRLQASYSRFKIEGKANYRQVEGCRYDPVTCPVPTTNTSERGAVAGSLAEFNDFTQFALNYSNGDLFGGTLVADYYWADQAMRYLPENGDDKQLVKVGPGFDESQRIFDQSEITSKKQGLRSSWTRGDVFGVEGLQLRAGVDLVKDEAAQRLALTDRLWVPPMKYSSTAPYAQLTWDIGPVTLSGGLRREDGELKVDSYTTTAYRNSVFVQGGGLKYTENMKNLGAIWRVTDELSVFASYGEGFGLPNIGIPLRNINVPGQSVDRIADLQAIIVDNREYGFNWRGDRGALGMSYYDSRSEFGTSLAIDPRTNDFILSRAPTRIKGFEANGEWRFSDAWKVTALYSRIRGTTEYYPGSGLIKKMGVLDINPDKIGASVAWNFLPEANVTLGATKLLDRDLRATHTRPDTGTVYRNEENTEGYVLFDLVVNYDTGRYGKLSLGIENLFDKQYILSWSQLPGWQNYWSGRGRMVSLSHSIKF
ncbi:TonB-dependent receptor [Stenotrophomonas acidaminiphila]|uniref:TonB-dependent receptor n=1 Tax=Stenotrophomonas TaxID=40323 RepID=UPI00135376AE|nr:MULTISPECIES: TonB-dependent receptor [Stenotrophomonas]MCH1909041.1 TonB-dependent receptor [Stenotrophomonas sp. Y6]MPS36580.1 TonB-dependent receptor [Stenotrophomonas sp.]MTI72043.1 TonB-dependent receptor [Stenotrophomonas sp.]WPU55918.1 TonB-dependent receptor [Stenotrophomonas acidaminiphila]